MLGFVGASVRRCFGAQVLLSTYAPKHPRTDVVQCSVAAGQTAASRKRGGKSELRRAVRRVTPGQGNLKDSGTENIPPTDGPA